MPGKQKVFISLAGGLATDVADVLVPVGKSLDITNMQLSQSGKLVKRYGHTALSVAPNSPWQITKYQGAKTSLALTGTAPISTYSPSQSAWVSPTSDRRAPLTVALTKVATKGGGTNPRVANGAGCYFLLYADQSTVGLMHFDVVDSTTLAMVKAQTFTAGTGVISYGIVFCNGFAVAITSEVGVGIVFRAMTPATLTFTTTTFADVPSLTSLETFDAIAKDATTISVVYANNAGNAAAVDFVPSTLVTTGWGPRDAASAAIPLDASAAWMVDIGASGKIAIVTASAAQGVRVQWNIPTAGATRQAALTYNLDATAFCIKIAAHTTGASATGDFQVAFTVASGVSVTQNFTKLSVRTGGVLTTGFVLYRSISLLSKSWLYQGEYYALFSFPSDLDGNSYVMRLPQVTSTPSLSAPQAIFGVGSTGNVDQSGAISFGLANVVQSGQTVVSAIGFLSRIGKQADGSYGQNSLGVELATLTFSSSTNVTQTGAPIESVGSLVVPGGMIGIFDGVTYAEMGFAYAPTQGVLTPGGGGGLTVSSRYWYSFVFAYEDGQGILWRSAPSVPQFVDMSGVQNSNTIGVPTLRVTGRSNVKVEIYRGAANDSVTFQKVSQVANDPTVDTVTYLDLVTDTALATGEFLYTNGGILPNTTIPGASFLFMFQNRLCFISSDDPQEIWFSNKVTPKNGVRFNTQNVIRIADERGAIYGASAMDDKVVAFKGSALYAFAGQGPDDAGNGSFSVPQIVALGIGCNQPRTIVSDKDGTFFNSTALQPGIQKIGRGLSIAQDSNGKSFGGAVMRYANLTFVSSMLIPEQSHVRFYTLGGRVLVYDLVEQIWTTFLLNLAGGDRTLSAVAINGSAVIVSDGQNVYTEDTSGVTYFDGTSIQGRYSASVTTPWIQGQVPRGFERMSEVIGVGKTVADHTLQVDMYTDFDDSAIVNTKTWSQTVASTPKWNWEWQPRVQRMSAVKLTITETSTAAGFEVEGVTVWVGGKSGLARQSTSTRGP